MQETEQQRQSGRRAFLVHFAAYAAVNAGLAALNLLQTPAAGEARDIWFVWPLAGWGIGVAAHWLALLLKRKSAGGGLFADRDVQGVAIHLFVYVAVNVLLLTVNLVATPASLWFPWPLLGWGIGLAAHAFLAYRAVMRRTVERYAAEQRVLAEIQLEKQAGEIAAALVPAEQPAAAKRKRVRKRTTAKKAAPKKKRAPARKRAPAKRRPRKPVAKSGSPA